MHPKTYVPDTQYTEHTRNQTKHIRKSYPNIQQNDSKHLQKPLQKKKMARTKSNLLKKSFHRSKVVGTPQPKVIDGNVKRVNGERRKSKMVDEAIKTIQQNGEALKKQQEQMAFEWILPLWFNYERYKKKPFDTGVSSLNGGDLKLYTEEQLKDSVKGPVLRHHAEYLVSIAVLKQRDGLVGCFEWGNAEASAKMLVKHMKEPRLKKYCSDYAFEHVTDLVMSLKGWDESDMPGDEIGDSDEDEEDMLTKYTKYTVKDVLKARRKFRKHFLKMSRDSSKIELENIARKYRFVESMVKHPLGSKMDNTGVGSVLMVLDQPMPKVSQVRDLEYKEPRRNPRSKGPGFYESVNAAKSVIAKYYFGPFDDNDIDVTYPMVLMDYTVKIVTLYWSHKIQLPLLNVRCKLNSGAFKNIEFLNVNRMKRMMRDQWIEADEGTGDESYAANVIDEGLDPLPQLFYHYEKNAYSDTLFVNEQNAKWDEMLNPTVKMAPMTERNKQIYLCRLNERLNHLKDLVEWQKEDNFRVDAICMEMMESEVKRVEALIDKVNKVELVKDLKPYQEKVKKIERELSDSKRLLYSHERRAALGIGSKLPDQFINMMIDDVKKLQEELKKAKEELERMSK